MRHLMPKILHLPVSRRSFLLRVVFMAINMPLASRQARFCKETFTSSSSRSTSKTYQPSFSMAAESVLLSHMMLIKSHRFFVLLTSTKSLQVLSLSYELSGKKSTRCSFSNSINSTVFKLKNCILIFFKKN